MSSLHPKLALLCLACLPAAALSQTATVTVNANTTVRTIDDRLFGANSTAWDSALGSTQTQSLLQNAGIRAIRLPGGSLSDEYHWRTNSTRNNAWTWASGFDKTSALIANLGAQSMITVNYGTGTPEEAAAWVAYANFPTAGGSDVTLGTDNPAPGTTALPTVGAYDWQTARTWASLRAASPLTTDDGMNFLRIGRAAPFGFRYWEIGNENYGSWESDLQSPAWNPATYANRAAIYLQKMRAVDPTIRIGVVVQTGNQYNNWTATVLGQLASLGAGARPDFVIYHRYDGGPGSEVDATLLHGTSTWGSDATDLRTQVDAAFGANNIEIVVTENNSVYSNPGKQSTSLVNGLFLADSLASVMATAKINGFFWWDIRNGPPDTSNNAASLYGWRTYGDYGILSSVATGGSSSYYETYPTYYAFKLLKYFARGGDTLVSAASGNPLLSVYAVRRQDNSHALLVINKDPANAITGNFTLTGIAATDANVYRFGKPNDDAAKANATGCADITASSSTLAAGPFAMSFPSYSMSVVSIGGPNYAIPSTMPAVVAQPAAQSITAGQNATFTADASGCPVPTYRWQRAASGSTTFTDIANGGSYAGADTATLTVSAATAAMSGDQFRLSASNATGSSNSNAVALTVAAAPSGGSGSSSSGGGGGGGGGALDLIALFALASLWLKKLATRKMRLHAP